MTAALTEALAAPSSTTGRGALPSLWRGSIVEIYGDGTVAAVIPALLADDAVRMPSYVDGLIPGEQVVIAAVEGRVGDFIVVGAYDMVLKPYVDEQIAGRAVTGHTHAYNTLTGIPTTFVPSAHTHVAADVSDSTALGRTLMKVADAAAARTAIGAGTSSLTLGTGATNAMPGNRTFTYSDLTGIIPTSALPPLAIQETTPVASQAAMLALPAQRGDVAIRTDVAKTFILATDSPGTLADWKEFLATGQVVSVGGKTGVVSLVKADVGLGNVDNTADAAKPVSTAAQAALDLKAPLASPAFTGTPTGITKAHVGLGSVDNTADAAKPVSTAAQAALDLKAPLASPAFTGTPTGITKTHVGLGNVDNTSDAAKPVSTATAAALGLKLDVTANRAQQTAVRPATDPPSAFPLGLSYFGAGTADGYPAGLCTVATIRNAVSRTTQTATGKIAADVWVRTETDVPAADSWTAWNKQATTDAATGSAAGLMSAADKAKLDAATAAATDGTLVTRYNGGETNFKGVYLSAAPVSASHATRKDYVDGKTWDGSAITTGTISDARIANATAALDGLLPKTDKAKLDAATQAATASTLALRSATGTIDVATPTVAAHAARKDYVDAAASNASNLTTGTVAAARLPVSTASVPGTMSAADKAKLDAATASPTVNTLALRNSAGRIQVTAPGTDTTAATPKSYVDALTDMRAGDGHQYKFLAGVIRNDGAAAGYWQLLPESTNHRPINIDSIVSYDNKIRIQYSALAAGMTIAFFAAPDETLAQEGIIMGTSVTPTYTDIKISQTAREMSDYVSYNGTSWVSQDGVFTGITFSAGTLTLNHASIPLAAQYSVNTTPRGGTYNYPVSGGSSPTGSTKVVLEVRDQAGTLITTPNTNMRVYVSHGGGTRDINPLLMDTVAYPLSNIWLWGIMGMD